MTTPKELNVPHWARAMVDNYRRSRSLPPEVTDAMIFARVEDCRGMDPQDIEEAVGELRDEVKQPDPFHIRIQGGRNLRFHYTNHRGLRSQRHVAYRELQYGFDGTYYTTPRLLLNCFDYERNAVRSFDCGKIEWDTLEVED